MRPPGIRTLAVVCVVVATLVMILLAPRAPESKNAVEVRSLPSGPHREFRPSNDAARGTGASNARALTRDRESVTVQQSPSVQYTLPPEGVPLLRVLAELRSAAESGSAPAGCRLGIDLGKCREVRLIPESTPEEKTFCEGILESDTDDAWRYLWAAAQQGNVVAMSKFARDPVISISNLAVASEGWAVYRNNAPRLLWQAVQGGDVMALFQSFFSSASGLTAGGKGVIERDPYNAVVYGTAALPLLDPRRQAMVERLVARLSNELKPDQVLQATADGERLRSQYFSASKSAVDTVNDGYAIAADCAR